MTKVFSEDFYNKQLFSNGERVYLTDTGTFEVAPKETKWNRFKRFMTFQQDSDIDKVHSQLKVIMEQIGSKSGPQFSDLQHEVHAHGKTKYKNLVVNLNHLREKLDHVGQPNLFSKLILKMVNVARNIFGKTSINLKAYTTVSWEREDAFWMANYSQPLRLSKYIHSSFNINTYHLEKEALKLTAEDKQSCKFSANSPEIEEKIQKLETGLENYWFLKQTTFLKQISANLEITFDSVKQQFSAVIRNPRGSEAISKELEKYLKGLPLEEKTVRYFIGAKDSQNQEQTHELVWTLTPTSNHRLNEGSIPLPMEPNVQYDIRDESNNLITSFAIKKNS